MRVRAVDINHEWLFGKGQNDYLTGVPAVVQNINTRLNSFLGDCFFDTGAGIDWFNFLGGKDTLALNLAVSAVILNTQDVTGITQLSLSVNAARRVTIVYTVTTAHLITAGDTFVIEPSGGGASTDVKSKTVAVSFINQQTKDIDVSVYSMNARRCEVTVIDVDTGYENIDIEVTRPSTAVIRLTAGGNITRNFSVLIFEAGA